MMAVIRVSHLLHLSLVVPVLNQTQRRPGLIAGQKQCGGVLSKVQNLIGCLLTVNQSLESSLTLHVCYEIIRVNHIGSDSGHATRIIQSCFMKYSKRLLASLDWKKGLASKF